MSNGGLHINGNCISPTLSASPPPLLSVPAPPPPPSLSSSSKLASSVAALQTPHGSSTTNLMGVNATATASTFRQTTNAHMNNNNNNNNNRGTSFIRCRCGTIGQLTADGHLRSATTNTTNTMGRSTINYGHPTNNIYTGYDGRAGGRLIDEEDSACPALLEREFHSLHRNVPGLRRAGVDTNAIRQHFYPDGGWGWIICGVAFLAHVLTTGFQLSFGILLIYAIPHLGQERAIETGWLGSTSWAISMFTTPIVIALCRRKSTRLTAVIGGLILALGILFASFATQFHQVAVSYGIIVGVGAAMVRESSAVMLGHYFKRRRQFVEMVTMAGEGVGITLFSVIFKEIVGNKNLGWRLGLQIVTGLISFCFFMGLFYRPASLYHPQRRAILHLKNQRKKVKEKKTHIRTPKPPFMDFTPFKSSTVRMFIVISFLASIGVYGPIFFISLHGYHEGYDVQDLVVLQTCLGLSWTFGIIVSYPIMDKVFTLGYKKFNITTQFVCQICIAMTSIAILILSGASYYRSMCIIACGYGLGLGGYRYSLKMFALERIRAKHFTKAWGFIRGAESISILFGVPFLAFLNDASVRYGRAGYYVGSAVTAISAVLMFFVGHPTDNCGGNCNNSNGNCGNCGTCTIGGPNCNNGHLISCGAAGRPNLSKYSTNGSITSHCTMPTQTTTTSTNDCPDLLNRSFSGRGYGCGSGLIKWCNSNNNNNNNNNNNINNNSTSHNSINNCTNNIHHQHLYHSHNQVGHHTNHRRHHSHQYPYGPLNTNNNNNNNQYLNNYYLQNHCHNDLITNNNTINNGRLHKSLSFAFQTPIMWNDCYLQSQQHHHQQYHHQQQQQQQQHHHHQQEQHQYQPHHRMSYSHVPYTNNRCWTRCDIHPQYISSSTNGLQQNPTRSRSVPEGLATNNTSLSSHGPSCECSTAWNYRNRWQSCSFRQPSSSSTSAAAASATATVSKPIQVVEQITTSV